MTASKQSPKTPLSYLFRIMFIYVGVCFITLYFLILNTKCLDSWWNKNGLLYAINLGHEYNFHLKISQMSSGTWGNWYTFLSLFFFNLSNGIKNCTSFMVLMRGLNKTMHLKNLVHRKVHAVCDAVWRWSRSSCSVIQNNERSMWQEVLHASPNPFLPFRQTSSGF